MRPLRFARSSIVILASLIGSQTYAAPAVNGVSGAWIHNNTIVISGSGFGAKPTAPPVLWDSVDNIPSYSALNDGDTIPVGGSNPWPSPFGNSNGRNIVKYETSDSPRGISTAQYKATNASGGNLEGLIWQNTGYSYVAWWFKIDRDVSGSDHSSKFLRMSDSNNLTGRTFSWAQGQSIIYDVTSTCNFLGIYDKYCANYGGAVPVPNKWTFMEAWFNSVNSTYSIRMDGSPIVDNKSYAPGTTPFNELWKIGFGSGGVSPKAVTWWIDQIYVDNSFARVMIGDAPSFSNSTKFEMQVPSLWSDRSIQISVNQGAFTTGGARAYLYVIDRNGNVNSAGFPITIDSGGSPVSAPPNPPADITVD